MKIKIKKLLGILILSSIALALFIAIIDLVGIVEFFKGFGFALGITALVFIGVVLVTNE